MSDILRRDPRAEWIARNRLHPLHAALQPAEVSWLGPNGVIRKNPHAVGFIGPNGLKRIDRSGTQQGGSQKRSTASAVVQLPLHVIEQPAFHIVVVPDMVGGRLSAHDKDLLGLAHKLAGHDGAVVAVVFGEHKEGAFDCNGVDRLLQFEGDGFDGYAPEARVLSLGALERQLSPRHWLLPDSRTGGGELGRRLAAKLGERPATRVWQVADGMASGRAGAGREDLVQAAPRLILAAIECAEPVNETRHEVRPLVLSEALVSHLPRIQDLGGGSSRPCADPHGRGRIYSLRR